MILNTKLKRCETTREIVLGDNNYINKNWKLLTRFSHSFTWHLCLVGWEHKLWNKFW